ncbi:hypothetical protein EV675_3218 [Pigmentiphaga kullae]|uniref:Uncharacterized protein n=1 Tax=Pigmentiphaga kullae TaxID=151784 RepID=A0A4Q7NCB0_9BURK|nr:hypothetical protein EV675_3218 [Pigmentiphaga kullae]
MSRVKLPQPIAFAFLAECGNVAYTGNLEGPYKRLREISMGGRRGASLDLISTEQAQAYADARVREALNAAADAIAYNAAACQDRLTEQLLRANEQAVRLLIPSANQINSFGPTPASKTEGA